MSVQLSTAVRNGRLNQIESVIGTGAILRIFTGSAPADCGTADSGTKLVEMTLPSDWLAAAASGSKAKSGTWSGTAVADGTAGYFRVYDSTGVTCGIQGTCGVGTGDLQLDSTTITTDDTVAIGTFTLTDANP